MKFEHTPKYTHFVLNMQTDIHDAYINEWIHLVVSTSTLEPDVNLGKHVDMLHRTNASNRSVVYLFKRIQRKLCHC